MKSFSATFMSDFHESIYIILIYPKQIHSIYEKYSEWCTFWFGNFILNKLLYGLFLDKILIITFFHNIRSANSSLLIFAPNILLI